MTLTWPKRVSIFVLIGALSALLGGWGGGAYALARKDAAQEQATQEAIAQVAQVKTDVDSIKQEIGKLRDDFSQMKATDAVQTSMTRQAEDTMKRVEKKVDDLLLMLSRKP